MNIMLIQAPLGRREPLVFPLGLAFLAGALDDHQVCVVDPNLPDFSRERFLTRLRRFNPEMIGVSLRNIDSQMLRDLHYYLPPFIELVREIRRKAPEARIVVGGAGFSLFPHQIMDRVPEIDVGVKLEGEQAFAALAAGASPESLPGMIYRRNGELLESPSDGFREFSDLPDPDWSLFDLSRYSAVRGAVGVQTKRGCNLECAYCTYPMLNGRRIRRRSPSKVVDEIEALVRQHGVRHFTFVDSIFNIPEDHAATIVDELLTRELPVTWSAWFNERPLTREFIERCLAAGCEEFSFSPDALNDRALQALGKNIRVTDIEKVLGFIETIPEMRVSFNFFINPPGNDLPTTWRLIRLFIKSKTRWRRRVTGFVLANPRVEPHTEIYARALREGVVSPTAELLPDDAAGLRRLFYGNPRTRYVEYAFRLYVAAWKLRQRIRRGGNQ